MSLLDSLILSIDKSIDLYGILKGMDQAFGEDIRRELGYEAYFWSSPEGLDIINAMALNPKKANWIFIERLIRRELRGRPVADGTIPPWEKDKEQKEKPVIKSDPPPFKDNTIAPRPAPGGGGKGLPPQRPVKRLPPRKLLPPITNPGFTTTEVTKPITAKAQIGNKQWGELVCYCLAEKGVTVVNPTLDPSTTNSNAANALESLYGIIFADAFPASLPLKQAIKSKVSWWAGSAWAAPSNIQGLTGDVSLIGGVDAIYDIAQAMAIASFNAYVGFQAELYLETETIENPGTIGTRSYADLPFLAGQNNMFYELGTLRDMDMGVFMGIPYDQWVRANPKTGNLQLQFYGKSQPPYSFKGPDGNTARYRPSEVNIPDPRELTWQEIKSVASQYQTGGHCCTIQLQNGRPIVAWANSNEAAESRARSLATLSTSPVTDKDPVFTIIKSKPVLTMYPGTATYTVGGSPAKQKMKLWVEKVEDSGYDDALLKEEDLSSLT